MIEGRNLVKRYGSTMAVNDLSFSIRPGMVTGFLGPNGAGKTTTMRMILGLDAPTQGSVTVGGRSYRDLPAPMREVGALLDAKALHGGRRCQFADECRRRVDDGSCEAWEALRRVRFRFGMRAIRPQAATTRHDIRRPRARR